MNTIDHGSWTRYTPDPRPEGAPLNAMFARRDGDGVDWYDYTRTGNHFGAGHVVIAAYWVEGQGSYVVGPATQTPVAIFPQGCIVHEITDYAGSDPQADLGDKRFDPATGVFTDLIPPPARTRETNDAILDRIKALETKLGGA